MTKGQTQSHVFKLLEYSIISSAHFAVFHFKSILFLNILIKIQLYHLPSSILLSSSILLPSLKSLKYPHQLLSRWPVFVLDYCSIFKSLFIWSTQTGKKGNQLYGLKIFSPLLLFLDFHIFWAWKDFVSLIWNSLQFLIFFAHNILYDGYLLSFCWKDELSSYCVAAGFLLWDSASFFKYEDSFSQASRCFLSNKPNTYSQETTTLNCWTGNNI